MPPRRKTEGDKRRTRRSALQRREYRSVPALLAEIRAEAGLSQAALAERLGKPQSWVAKSESGTRRLDVLELLAILDALNFTPAAFLRRLKNRGSRKP